MHAPSAKWPRRLQRACSKSSSRRSRRLAVTASNEVEDLDEEGDDVGVNGDRSDNVVIDGPLQPLAANSQLDVNNQVHTYERGSNCRVRYPCSLAGEESNQNAGEHHTQRDAEERHEGEDADSHGAVVSQRALARNNQRDDHEHDDSRNANPSVGEEKVGNAFHIVGSQHESESRLKINVTMQRTGYHVDKLSQRRAVPQTQQ
ncbi:uncharacterized protein BcabD6B2_36290 [Babesia caballi]|uniref:Uncharacterized protein n=1 Tax=Babesia caballi TaxID=5871 RepID=A0AAV4LVV4_BABCB|nr:hypothetical protein BcabD6B2_36290 [Babesia caballi]